MQRVKGKCFERMWTEWFELRWSEVGMAWVGSLYFKRRKYCSSFAGSHLKELMWGDWVKLIKVVKREAKLIEAEFALAANCFTKKSFKKC